MDSTERGSADLFAQVDRYGWSSDADYQAGLRALLGSNAPWEQAVDLTIRARCFYYSRKYSTTVDFDSYKAWREERDCGAPTELMDRQRDAGAPASSPSSGRERPESGDGGQQSPAPEAPYPNNFARIAALISSGQPIPHVMEVPDTVLTDQGSESTLSSRTKPWQRNGC